MYYRRRKISKKKTNIIFVGIILIVLVLLLTIIEIVNNIKMTENIIDFQEIEVNNLKNVRTQMTNANNSYKTYYISSDGTSKDGTDINEPMSLEEANQKIFYGNEKILFKCNDIFYGSINFKNEAKEGELLYIGSYGDGKKPIISGAKVINKREAWEKEGEFYKVDLSSDNVYGIAKEKNHQYNIGFIKSENNQIFGHRKKSKELVANQMDFYCKDNYLYVKSEENPFDKYGEIHATTRTDLIRISSNMVIDGLNLIETGAHGIVKKDNLVKKIYINNCILQDIGGSVLKEEAFVRYGNGIEFYNANIENVLIEKNIFRNIYDAAFTMQGTSGKWSNVRVTENIFIQNTQNCELWNDINAEGVEAFEFSNNISINTGKNWGYNVRNNKEVATDFLMYEFKKNLSCELENNKIFNSRQLYYILPSTRDVFKNNVRSDNNKFYVAPNIIIMNENIENIEQFRNMYKKEYNSTYRELNSIEINSIYNLEVLESNDYNYIKSYYENVEKEYIYTDALQSVIQQYTDLEEKYLKNSTTKEKINTIKTNMQNTTNATDITYIMQQLEETYKLGRQIINNQKEQKNEIIKQLEKIGRNYKELIKLKNTSLEENVEQIEILMNSLEKQIDNNSDINIHSVLEVKDLAKIYSNEIEKEQDYMKKYYYISAKYLIEYANILLNNEITNYVTNNLITESYSERNITNGDVTVTLNIGDDTKITNNNGSNQYTFKENGEYTFEYERRGRNFRQTVKVENIDKQSPKITGVEEGQVYENKIKPIIEDENLETVRLIQDGRVIDNYINNTEIKEEGMYRIEAFDKAGNKTVTSFEIIENISKEYIIENNIIKNIEANTTVEKFKEKIKIQTEYKIQRGEKELEENEKIATGDILQIGDTQYTLIVRGDIDKDSKITIKDLILLRQQIIGEKTLEDTAKTAGDIDLNEKIDARDIVKLRKLILTNNK